MNPIIDIIQKILFFEKEPQKIGLSQFKEKVIEDTPKEASIKNKNIKLSDLMRRESIKG